MAGEGLCPEAERAARPLTPPSPARGEGVASVQEETILDDCTSFAAVAPTRARVSTTARRLPTPLLTLPHKLALGRAQARPGWGEGKRMVADEKSRRDFHVLEIAGFIVDADARRRDPVGELPRFRDRLHQADDEITVVL